MEKLTQAQAAPAWLCRHNAIGWASHDLQGWEGAGAPAFRQGACRAQSTKSQGKQACACGGTGVEASYCTLHPMALTTQLVGIKIQLSEIRKGAGVAQPTWQCACSSGTTQPVVGTSM